MNSRDLEADIRTYLAAADRHGVDALRLAATSGDVDQMSAEGRVALQRIKRWYTAEELAAARHVVSVTQR